LGKPVQLFGTGAGQKPGFAPNAAFTGTAKETVCIFVTKNRRAVVLPLKRIEEGEKIGATCANRICSTGLTDNKYIE
jgi:hypothetical protein